MGAAGGVGGGGFEDGIVHALTPIGLGNSPEALLLRSLPERAPKARTWRVEPHSENPVSQAQSNSGCPDLWESEKRKRAKIAA